MPNLSQSIDPKRQRRLVDLGLVLLTVLIYRQVGSFEFVNFDDPMTVINNDLLSGGWGPSELWKLCTGFWLANWHPLTFLSLKLDRTFFGLDPGPYHLVNLALHLCNVLLLRRLCERLSPRPWVAVAVAALFAAHPLHVESVAWITERKDVLSAAFWFLTTIYYLDFVRTGQRRDWGFSLGFFALGLMSKPMLVTLPVTLILLEYWPLARLSWPPRRADLSRLLKDTGPYFALSAATSWITLIAQDTARDTRGALDDHVLRIIYAYGQYLWKTIAPVNLIAFYGPPEGGFQQGATLAALVALLAISAVAVALRKRHGYLLFGWLWFLVTLLPVIGLVKVGGQVIADRYTYIPHVGLFLAVAIAAAELAGASRLRRGALILATTMVVAVFAVLAARQAETWRNGEQLWSHALEYGEKTYNAETNLGSWLFDHRRYAEALPHFQCRPKKETEGNFHAQQNQGYTLTRLGSTQEGIPYLRKALELEPEDFRSTLYLGEALLISGDTAAAEPVLRRAVALRPSDLDATAALILALSRQNHQEQADELVSKLLTADPSWPNRTLSEVWRLSADPRVIPLDPGQAVFLGEQLVAASGGSDPAGMDALAAAWAAKGDFERAVKAAQKALDLLANAPDKRPMIAPIKERLGQYQSHKPYLFPVAH